MKLTERQENQMNHPAIDGLQKEARAALARRPNLIGEIYEIVSMALAEIYDGGSPDTETDRAIEDIRDLLAAETEGEQAEKARAAAEATS
jgi:hypothetical protein